MHCGNDNLNDGTHCELPYHLLSVTRAKGQTEALVALAQLIVDCHTSKILAHFATVCVPGLIFLTIKEIPQHLCDPHELTPTPLSCWVYLLNCVTCVPSGPLFDSESRHCVHQCVQCSAWCSVLSHSAIYVHTHEVSSDWMMQ